VLGIPIELGRGAGTCELDQDRFVLRLVSLFTLLAIILAGTGVYGVLAYGVARRTREIGVRVALGARSEQVVSDVLKRGIGFAAAGCALGAIGALAAHRLIRGLLYDGPKDPVALAAATVLIAAVAIAASLGPAQRAVRISPVEAMRVD
jgi:ABC-type antimicrobial peptide transport system permease subunit